MKKLVLIWIVSLCVVGCKSSDEEAVETDIQETAQQVGDIMASMDEQGGDDGSVASLQNYKFQKTFERFNQEPPLPTATNIASMLISNAEAVTCYTSGTGTGWGSCSGRVITRSYNGCTIGAATLSGDVTLTWAGAGSACDWAGSPSAGSTITRVPNFQLTGRRGATLAVTKTGTNGQVLTYVSGSGSSMVLNFTNDGIRRKFTSALNATLFDQTTTVVSSTPLVVTGNSRTSRVMNGGFLTVTDTLNGVICNFSPSNVTWNSTSCNCPIQGSWSGSCDNGKSTTLTLTGCGTANYTEGGDITSVTFDRCSSN